jgi:hypothetical protein
MVNINIWEGREKYAQKFEIYPGTSIFAPNFGLGHQIPKSSPSQPVLTFPLDAQNHPIRVVFLVALNIDRV